MATQHRLESPACVHEVMMIIRRMMRYGVRHKEESRERILQAAARQFRAGGAEVVRVADVMQAAGITF